MNSKERNYFIKKQTVKHNITQSAYYHTFTAYLQAKNLTPKSVERYTQLTEQYKKWLWEHREITPENADKKDLLDYLQFLQEKRKISGHYRQQILGTMRHYYTFLQQQGEIETNPANSINLRGTKKKILHKILSLEELNELLDSYYLLKVKTTSEQYQHFHKRNYLILSLYVYQGLTRTQIHGLTLDDLDLHKATLTVQAEYRNNARTLPLQASQIGIFYDYLNNARPLFGNENGKLINSNPELQKLTLTVKKLYPKFTGFTQLRASIITHWIQTEGLRKAQYKAGHRYISSTEEYIANDLESLKDDINKYHPI